MIYLDSAAVVKPARAELDERAETRWISSVPTRDRIFPCARPVRARGGPPPRLPVVLDHIDLD